MQDYLYRFRTIESLLSTDDLHVPGAEKQREGRDELRKQEIYFASPDKLNDPIEGYKNFFWSGDEIIWKNLFKHYLLNLQNIFLIYNIAGEEHEISTSHVAMFNSEKDLPTQQYKDTYKRVCDSFFSDPSASQYPKGLASRINPVRRNELLWYFSTIHFYAIKCIADVYAERGLLKNNFFENKEFQPQKIILNFKNFDLINQLEKEHPDKPDATEEVFAAQRNTMNQLNIISEYNNKDAHGFSKNKKLVFQDYPEEYLKQLEKIIHYDWYTACFSDDYSNPSVWGHYAGSHSGVCLKFKVNKGKESESLTLKGINGCGGSKDSIKYHHGDINFSFYKVRYEEKYPEIDFFRSIGRMPVGSLYSAWLLDENGAKSVCCSGLEDDQESWRKNYWDNFYANLTTKLKDWQYENEYRLILSSVLFNYNEIKPVLSYKLEDLEGIIFGIKTSHADKLKLMNIVEAKCRENGRKDFSFYQAYHSSRTGKIKAAKLSLLNFSSTEHGAIQAVS